MEASTVAGSGKRWFALYTKPHKEYQVQGLLCDQGVEVFLPQARIAARRRDRRGKKPFFPHYLFARLDPRDGLMAKVHWTPGLRRVVSSGGLPVPVPDEVVNYLRRRLEGMGGVEPEGAFKTGDAVRVVHGPFKGLDAIFDRRLSPDGRVHVFLDLMGRLVAAELDTGDLLAPR